MTREADRAMMENRLRRISDLRSRTYRLIGFQDATLPGLPAREDQLRAVEEAFHCTLAPSYRRFLSIHNGWQFWSGDQAVLQYYSPQTAREWQFGWYARDRWEATRDLTV